MTKLPHYELTQTIIGAYYEVYNHTSRIFPEYIYEQAMIEELRQRGISTTRQDKYQITYKNYPVGLQQLDLFIAGEIVVENKAVDQLTRLHKAQAISYLKTVDKLTGLLFNFGGPQPEFNRLYFNPAKKPTAMSPGNSPGPSPDWLYPDLAYEIVGGLYEVHTLLGAGFVHRIYANACYQELKLRGLATKPAKRMQVAYKGKAIGDIAFAHLLVEGKIIVFPAAIGSIQDIHLENLKQWLALSDISLGILANFDAVKLEIMFIRR
ncbi:MAG: GxxExxY protein [Anaerolineae bacterium]|nr:GxxExxY protein [Anaerolineae bacterium]